VDRVAHCNILARTHCAVLGRVARCNILQHCRSHSLRSRPRQIYCAGCCTCVAHMSGSCHTLRHAAPRVLAPSARPIRCAGCDALKNFVLDTRVSYRTLQRAATRCNTLKHAQTRSNRLHCAGCDTWIHVLCLAHVCVLCLAHVCAMTPSVHVG